MKTAPMPEILVEIHDTPSRVYAPGDRLRGELIVTTDSQLKCKNVWARLQCYAHGHGHSTSQDIASLLVYEGALQPGMHRFDFEFDLPAGPYSYNGHYTNLGWAVQGHLAIPWARDMKRSEAFILSPGHVPARVQEMIPEQLTAHKTTAELVFLTCGVGLMGVALMCLVMLTQDPEYTPYLCVAISTGLYGLVVLGLALPTVLTSCLITNPHITLRPWPVRPLKPSIYQLTFTPGTRLTLNSVVVELTCNEVVEEGGGTTSTIHTHEVYSHIFTLSTGGQFQKGTPVTFIQEICLPTGAPCSFTLTNNKVIWQVKTRIGTSRWLDDWEDTHIVHVAPPRRMGDEKVPRAPDSA